MALQTFSENRNLRPALGDWCFSPARASRAAQARVVHPAPLENTPSFLGRRTAHASSRRSEIRRRSKNTSHLERRRRPLFFRWATIAVALGYLAAGCAAPIASGLKRAKHSEAGLKTLEVIYEERSAAWGGRRIEVRGGGEITMYVHRPGFSLGELGGVEPGKGSIEGERALDRAPENAERVLSGRLERARLIELVDRLIELKAWRQRAKDDAGRVDPAKARLRIRVDGGESEIWEIADDLEAHSRLVQIRQLLEALARSSQSSPADEADQADDGATTTAPPGEEMPSSEADELEPVDPGVGGH